MKTILTIDFDIVIGNHLEIYNYNINDPWGELLKEHSLSSFLPINTDIYRKITNFICSLYNQLDSNKIHFLQEHHHIIHHLTDDKYHLINIDHHHDWCYNNKNFITPIQKDEIDCGNWVKYLSDNDQLLSYTWIKNDTSRLPFQEQHFNSYNIQNHALNFNNIDEIYIVLSPQYVPFYYHNLFFLWIDMAKEYYKTGLNIEV